MHGRPTVSAPGARRRGEPHRQRTKPIANGASTAAPAASKQRALKLVAGPVVPVTRDVLQREACVALSESPETAMRELDAVAQRLGVSSLS